jgi:hypothetical protein
MANPRRRKVDWEKFGRDLADRVLEGLDYWCWNISPESAKDCYATHANLNLFELAEEFANWSVTGISDKDLELLKKMPDNVFDKLDREVRERIERVVRELEAAFPEETVS